MHFLPYPPSVVVEIGQHCRLVMWCALFRKKKKRFGSIILKSVSFIMEKVILGKSSRNNFNIKSISYNILY